MFNSCTMQLFCEHVFMQYVMLYGYFLNLSFKNCLAKKSWKLLAFNQVVTVFNAHLLDASSSNLIVQMTQNIMNNCMVFHLYETSCDFLVKKTQTAFFDTPHIHKHFFADEL